MKKKILITGSNGMLGSRLIKRLIVTTDYYIIAVVGSEEKYQSLLEEIQAIDVDKIECLMIDEFFETNLGDLYAAIHLAFSRRNRSTADIAESIDFSAKVFKKLAKSNVQRVINVSSQGIYGDTNEIRTEKTVPAPVTLYTMAKYATEKIFDICFNETNMEHTNIRLDLVIQSQNLVPALCKQATDGRIYLKGGKQRFSFIDADDVTEALIAMLDSSSNWEAAYNVGWNEKRYTLLEVAEVVADVAVQLGYDRPEILLETQDINLWSGMNSKKFTNHTGWKPTIDLTDMVKRIFQTILWEKKYVKN